MFTKEIVNVSDQQFQDKREVISYLADLADKAGKITDKKSYVEAVLKREEVVSTAIGYSVAIPHGESDAVKDTFVACLKLNHPLQWDCLLYTSPITGGTGIAVFIGIAIIGCVGVLLVLKKRMRKTHI